MRPAEYIPLTPLAELSAYTPTRFELPSGEAVCLIRDAAVVRGFVDVCPHRGHPVSEGAFSDGVLKCALHGWEFDVEDGSAISPRAPFRLEQKVVRVNDGVIEVAV